MTTQPEALRLADALRDGVPYDEAEIENELRRLSAENERLHQINQSHEMKLSVRGYEIQIADLEAQRDALLEAVQGIVDFIDGPAEAKRPDVFLLRISKARAAIKAVEEGK